MWVVMASNTEPIKIYVRLLDEGTVVFRPTLGLPLGENWFQLLPTEDYDPEDETWQFLPGTTVKGELQMLNEEEVLVAT